MIILTGRGRAVHEGWGRAEAQPSWQEACTTHYGGSVSKTEHLITKKCVRSRKRLREARADALRGEGLVAKRLLCRPFGNS